MTATAIEWATDVWNPTTGCDKVSPGCGLPRWPGDEPHGQCYALTMARRLKGMGSEKYQRDGDPATSGPGFGITEHPAALDAPLHWAKPRKIFVNSMSDLFHRGVTDEFIAQVFAVMAVTPRHTYQVLTKRHGRMRSLLRDEGFVGEIAQEAVAGNVLDGWPEVPVEPGMPWWPLPNVWLGVSVEDQQRADLRIPALLDTPAAVRFLSCEPLIGPVDIDRYLWLTGGSTAGPFFDHAGRRRGGGGIGGQAITHVPSRDLHWVIAGGESGAGARPMHPEWARRLRDQCTAAGVPFFFKQWGEWTPYRSVLDRLHRPLHVWEDSLGPDGAHTEVCRLGKKLAGRELDGRSWDEFPAAVTA